MNLCAGISSAKANIQHILNEIKRLRESSEYLQDYIRTDSPKEFDTLMQEIQQTKVQLNRMLEEYENVELQRTLKRKLDKRLKKRKKNSLKHKRLVEKRKHLHKAIDECLLSVKRDDTTRLHQVTSFQKAKNSLTVINKKKSEAVKNICVIKSRNLDRIKELINSDQNPTDDDLEQLLEHWENKLQQLQEQENTLKNILAFNSKSLEDQWRKCLFDYMSHDRKVVKPAELNKFCNIRAVWDSYVVSEFNVYGSSIPSGWVCPPANASQPWAEYMFKDDFVDIV